MPRTKGVQLSQPSSVASQVTSIPLDQNKGWWDRFKEFLIEKPELLQYINKFNPEQQEASSSILQGGLEKLKNPSAGFEPIRKDALNTFNQDVVPSLLERFSASGSNSASSPVVQSQLSGAGASLADRLAAFQAQFAQQNEQTGLQQLQLGLNPQSEIWHRPRVPGAVENTWNRVQDAIPALIRLASGL